MTVADIISAVEANSDKKVQASPPASLLQSDVFSWINEVLVDIVDTLRDYVDYAEQDTVIDQVEYSVPTDCNGDLDSVLVLTYDKQPLEHYFLTDLTKRYRSNAWESVGSKTLPYFYLKLTDEDKVAILPKPPAVKKLGVYYLKTPTVVTATTDTIPRYFVSLKRMIVDWCLMRCALKDRRLDLAKAYKDLYDAALAKKAAVRPQRSIVNDALKEEDENNR